MKHYVNIIIIVSFINLVAGFFYIGSPAMFWDSFQETFRGNKLSIEHSQFVYSYVKDSVKNHALIQMIVGFFGLISIAMLAKEIKKLNQKQKNQP